jgi:hypothetical protein
LLRRPFFFCGVVVTKFVRDTFAVVSTSWFQELVYSFYSFGSIWKRNE